MKYNAFLVLALVN